MAFGTLPQAQADLVLALPKVVYVSVLIKALISLTNYLGQLHMRWLELDS